MDTKFILEEFQGHGVMHALGRLASVLLRAIMSKSCSTFRSQNLADIWRNRPNLVLKLGLHWRNFDSLGID